MQRAESNAACLRLAGLASECLSDKLSCASTSQELSNSKRKKNSHSLLLDLIKQYHTRGDAVIQNPITGVMPP